MFWASGHKRPNFGSFYLHSLCGAALFGSHHHLPPSVWQSLIEFRLLTSVCNACRQRSRMQSLWKVGKISGPMLSRLLSKVHDTFRRCWRPLALSNALAQLSTSSFIQKMFAIKFWSCRKTEQMYKVFTPSCFLRDNPDFPTADC